ncbi:AI-2E family transporter [Enterococcus mundtii]|uniref:AI-2E family transporter n=1 Tax=Enterococcus mundtii TaxID=53346 RepID=UPI000D3D104B|nr:AI-2E family transporter [Enterococcus mundtii]PTO39630.1 AI-2E family transporter [Enterococcus mundtii]PTO45205.1 AI-2E family transporter [Enterococcus mundtii]
MTFLKRSKLFATLVLLSLTGITIFIFSKITFIFRPLEAIMASIFLPILISVFLFYIFLPIYNQLLKYIKSRTLAVTLMMLLILLTVYLIVQVVLPIIILEISKFIGQVPQILYVLAENLDGSLLEERLLPFIDTLELNQLTRFVLQFVSGATSSLVNVFEIVSRSAIILFTIPLLLIYMFKDGDRIPAILTRYTPKKFHQLVRDWCHDFHLAASTYISGKLLVCTYVGVGSYLVFKVLGLPNALLLALICGLMDIIPYFGPFIGAAPALLYALSQDVKTALLLVAFITLIQFGESYLVSPLVMNKMIHIHPIATVFLLLVAGNLFGLLGMILVLPTYTIIREMIRSFLRFKNTADTANSTHQTE